MEKQSHLLHLSHLVSIPTFCIKGHFFRGYFFLEQM